MRGDDCRRDFEKTNLQDLGLLMPFRGGVEATLPTLSITSHLILCMFYKDGRVQEHISLFPSLVKWTFSSFAVVAAPHWFC